MEYYYVFILLMAFVLCVLPAIFQKKFPDISIRMCRLVVLWALVLSFLLPGLIKVVSPGISLLIIFFFFLPGGYYIIHRVNRANQRQIDCCRAPVAEFTAGASDELPAGGVEQKEPSVPVTEKELLAPNLLLLPKGVYWEESGKEALLLADKDSSHSELFESAFQARAEGNYELAIEKLKLALAGTNDVLLKGVIYTELVFLCKEAGKYLQAAGMLRSFISEHGTALNPSLLRYFTLNISFLQTVDQLLEMAEQPGLPYSRVPRLIKLRAEKLLKE